MNFSSATTPELLLKTFDHYCEYRRTPNGVVMAPAQLGKWLVLFCDEINLPDMDNYGTVASPVLKCAITFYFYLYSFLTPKVYSIFERFFYLFPDIVTNNYC